MAPSATDTGSPRDKLRPILVSIGASAGGVTALQTFFEALPDRTGAAFVVVVHLDPEHASDMSRIIAGRTKMPVIEVVQDEPIEADKVYVIPPNRRLLVSADQISSAPFDQPRGQRAPIDQFFRSVADEHGDGFAVILTGGGSDGTVGVKAIKEAGGLILVQDPNEAEYPSMPQSAIASGVADFVLPVRDIARRLPSLIQSKQQLAFEDLASKDEEALRRILLYLRQKTGHDFSEYKRATVGRRLARRMQVTHTEVLQDYLSHLQAHPNEVQALLADLLISVTSFFRDPAAFEALAEEAIKPLLDEHEVNGGLYPIGTARDSRSNHAVEHRQAVEKLGVPSMLVDNAHRILNLSENGGRFLLQPGGPLTTVADDLVRPELRLDLQASLHRVFEQNEATMTLPLAVKFNGTPRQVSLYVNPVNRDTSRLALVLLLEGGPATAPEQTSDGKDEGSASHVIAQLRNELATTQGHLRTTRSQYEAVTEELRASNEELQSINEEYRSTSEELETSKEELQSINEELQTLNNELKLKLDVVSRAHNDLQNLMSATDVATFFLTTSFRINRFTPSLSEIFNVAPGDEGRPISDFTHRLEHNDMIEDAERVLAELTPVERVLKAIDGRWFLMRIRPYRTVEDRIEGVVATFVDVTEQREAEKKWEARQQLLISELSHRVRNTLSVVQAVVGQTLRSRRADPELQQVIIQRLQSIAKTHEMIVRDDWSGADLEAIARDQLAPHLGQTLTRVEFVGPPVLLPSEIATSVGLLLHELATNASKYGALSQSGGNVHLTWEMLGTGRDRRVKLTWRESGGPRITQPGSPGFGTSLIESSLPGASVHREFRPEGFLCTIEFSVSGRGQRQPEEAKAASSRGRPGGSEPAGHV